MPDVPNLPGQGGNAAGTAKNPGPDPSKEPAKSGELGGQRALEQGQKTPDQGAGDGDVEPGVSAPEKDGGMQR